MIAPRPAHPASAAWPLLPPLPVPLAPAGPLGVSGPCELLLLDASQLQGCLSAFHDGDLALDLKVPRRRQPLCVPLSRLQWLHLDALPQLPPDVSALQGLPVELSGPVAAPVRGECLGERQVPGGRWLLLRDESGRLGQWFVHRRPDVGLRCLDEAKHPRA